MTVELQREATTVLQRLVRLNTVNPPGNERPAQELLRAFLDSAGFETALLGEDPARPNLVARLKGRGPGPGPRPPLTRRHRRRRSGRLAPRPLVGRARRRLRVGTGGARH